MKSKMHWAVIALMCFGGTEFAFGKDKRIGQFKRKEAQVPVVEAVPLVPGKHQLRINAYGTTRYDLYVPRTGTYRIALLGARTDMGWQIESLAHANCDWSVEGRNETCTVVLRAGTTYKLVVDEYLNVSAAFELLIQQIQNLAPGSNGIFVSANSSDAYLLSVPDSGVYRISLKNGDTDLGVVVYGEQQRKVGECDDYDDRTDESCDMNLEAGQSYWVVVDDYLLVDSTATLSIEPLGRRYP